MKDIIKNQDKSIEYYMTRCQELESINIELKQIIDSLEKDIKLFGQLRTLDINYLEKLKFENDNLKSQFKSKSSYNISKFDITLQQLELLFDFLPGVKYFASEYQLLHDVYPSESECNIYKDLKNKIYSLILNLSI